MYGFIHKALEDLVLSAFGKDQWDAILEKAEVQYENGPFLSHSSYEDGVTMKLILTTCQVLNLELDTALEVFGGHFLVYCQTNGYDRILRVLGGNMFDMLSNLDNLHDHLESQYPGIRAPSFKCSVEGEALILHYFSVRKGLEAIVRGLVKAIGKSFFNTEVKVSTQTDESDGHVSLTITADQENANNAEFKKLILQPDNCVSKVKNKFPNRTFVELFPFHIIINRNLDVVQAGVVFLRITRDFRRALGHTANFTDFFELIRPRLTVGFDSFVAQVNQMYVVRTKNNVIKGNDSHSPYMKLKGQMVLLQDDKLLFLCSPRFQNTCDLEESNLYLADIPIHDHCRDLLLLNINRGDERELVQKLEEGSNRVKTLELELQDDKKRTDELLHSILPAKVAQKLRLNLPVESETFDTVSALFSDIVGFTALCSSPNVKPINIVHLLSLLYTQFDELTHSIGVYKLETIGDAYIVVGGLPDFVEDHADRTILMGLEMIDVVDKVVSPADGQPLKMRIGIHTGSVMAGVVGKMMPRYCCFGNMMTIANKMESNGLPMCTTISQVTKSHLTKNTYTFKEHKEVAGLETFLVTLDKERRPRLNIDRTTIKKQFSEVDNCQEDRPNDSGQGKSISSPSSVDTVKTIDQRRRSRIPIAKKLIVEPPKSIVKKRNDLPKLNFAGKIPTRPTFIPHRCSATFPIDLRTMYSNDRRVEYFRNRLPVVVKRGSVKLYRKKEADETQTTVNRSIKLPPIQTTSSKGSKHGDPYAVSIEQILSLVGGRRLQKMKHN